MKSIKPPSFICFSSDRARDDCSEITEPQDTTPFHDLCHRFFMTTEQREILELKQQLSKQQDMINLLELKLSRCQLEKEELEDEKAVLIEERTDQQMPVDLKHAKLMRENARLQVVCNVMRESFKNSSEDVRRKSESDKQRIKALEKENENLQFKVLRFSQVDVNRNINEFRFSGNSAQEVNTVKPQLERQLSSTDQGMHKKELDQGRKSLLSKSNMTAPTYLISESGGTYTYSYQGGEDDELQVDSSKSCEQGIHSFMKCVDIEDASGTDKVKDIDAEELKEVIPWMKWAAKAKVPTQRAS